MKKFIGILLLLLHVLAFTECRQLLRLPYLMKHFQQHQSIDPDMNLAKFIQLHYFSPLTITDDFMQDQQLPFRSVDSHLLNTTVFKYEPISFRVVPPVLLPTRFFYYNETNKPQFSSIDIFQPPRSSGLI